MAKQNSKLSVSDVQNMGYVDLMAHLDEINRPPGGKDSVRIMVQNTFLNSSATVLDVGCNTGFCTFEVAHLSKAHVIGLDINKNMIQSANNFLLKEHSDIKDLVQFILGDATKLPFEDNTFDLTFSGGSTAFIPDIPQAIREYNRVTKLWGFIADINFFYHTPPPLKIIKKLNDLMGTDIQPWDSNYWLEHYRQANLELYYYSENKMKPVADSKIEEYCNLLIKPMGWSTEVKEVVRNRLKEALYLFNQNHAYLGFGVFIMRKRPFKEVTLF